MNERQTTKLTSRRGEAPARPSRAGERLATAQRHRQHLGVALFPLGAFVVHQVRYQLAFGPDASRRLAEQGHGYLQELMPWIVLAVALGLGGLIARLAGAWRTGECVHGNGRRVVVLWALASAGLFSIYLGQELLEGLFATGHAGLAGILGAGGLWALPVSIIVGGLLTLLVCGGGALVARVAAVRRRRARSTAARAPKRVVRPDCVALPRLAPLAGASAGRAPPAGLLLST